MCVCFSMKSNNTVTFNLQNTHKYTLGTASLAKYPDTLLALMVHHDGTEKELFISQDGELFRWVCVFYNLGILVDHKEANCPEKVWDAYLDYFGLTVFDTSGKRACTELIRVIGTKVVPPNSKVITTFEIMKMIDWMIKEKQKYCHFPMTTQHTGFSFNLSVIRYVHKDLLIDIWETLHETIDCSLLLCKMEQLFTIHSPAKELKPFLKEDCQMLAIEIKSQFID